MVYDTTGTNVAHGANAALIGKNLIDLKDTNGKLLIRELVSTKDQAFVDYTWPHPVTKKILPKSTYVVRVGNCLIGVGAYK
jgi:cytochrome c